MAVSIIVCTYNDSHLLPKALKSCFEHDVEKEVILVDDASTKPFDPGAMELVKSLGVKYIRHDQNSGLSSARNTGIRHSKYDLIIPMDADDFFYPNTVKVLYDNMGTADVAYGNVTDSGMTHYPITEEPLRREHFLSRNPLFCSSLFKKSAWEKVGGYHVRDHAFYEDYRLWCEFFMAGCTFKYVPVTVYEHANRPDSMLKQLHSNGPFFTKIAQEPLMR